MGLVISESCNKGIRCFYCHFPMPKNWEPQHDSVISQSMFKQGVL